MFIKEVGQNTGDELSSSNSSDKNETKSIGDKFKSQCAKPSSFADSSDTEQYADLRKQVPKLKAMSNG